MLSYRRMMMTMPKVLQRVPTRTCSSTNPPNHKDTTIHEAAAFLGAVASVFGITFFIGARTHLVFLLELDRITKEEKELEQENETEQQDSPRNCP